MRIQTETKEVEKLVRVKETTHILELNDLELSLIHITMGRTSGKNPLFEIYYKIDEYLKSQNISTTHIKSKGTLELTF